MTNTILFTGSNISTPTYFGYINNCFCWLYNNVWGATTLERQNNSIIANIFWNNNNTFGWEWNRPDPNPGFYTHPLFQEAFIGKRYWDLSKAITTLFPIQIKDINSLTLNVTCNYPTIPTGWFDLAFDAWITKVYPPTHDVTQRMDCFIVLQGMNNGKTKDPLSSPVIETVSDGINSFKHHYNATNGDHGFTLDSLQITDTNQFQYTINLKALFDILTTEGYLDNSWYLPGIEFGNETFHGTGKIEISNFDVILNGISNNYKLAFADDFMGSSLDTSKWIVHNNVQLENGTAKIGPTWKNSGTGYDTSSRLTTIDTFKYGYIEINAKLAATDTENSYASQLWLSTLIVEEHGGEIDLTETSSGTNYRNIIYSTVHDATWYGSNDPNKGTKYLPNLDLSQNFHTYAVEWTPNDVKCLFDGYNYHIFVSDPSINFIIPEVPMYIVLSLCRKWDATNAGQCWPSTNVATIDAYMYIDYVRIYQAICQIPTYSIEIK